MAHRLGCIAYRATAGASIAAALEFSPTLSPQTLCSTATSSSDTPTTNSDLVRRATNSTKDTVGEYLTANPSLVSVFAICFPNAYMLYMHKRGATGVLVKFVLRNFGVYGLFAVPFLGIALEKSFYDTAMCIQGIDPNETKPGREGEGFPSGGRLLPSFSIVPVMKRGTATADEKK